MAENETASDQVDAHGNLLLVLLRQVRRFRLLVAFTAVLGLIAGLFYGLTVPNQYQSVGKLYVRPGIRDIITPEAAFASARAASQRAAGSREAVLNELQVLSGPQLFDKVVDIVGVDLLLAPYQPPPLYEGASWLNRRFHEFQTWWFEPDSSRAEASLSERKKVASMLLGESVSITAEAGTSVITCAYAASSPETARLVVNAVLEAAGKVHNEVFETMSSLDDIEGEMKSAEDAARKAEEALRAFRLEHDIHSFDSEYAAVLAYLKDLERQLDTTDLQAHRKQAEREVVEKIESRRLQDSSSQVTPSVTLNPNITSMNGLLTQLRLRQLELEGLKGSLSSGEYIARTKALETVVSETKNRLDDESTQLQIEVARSENPLYLRIAETLDDLKVELKSLEVMRDKTDQLRKDSSAALDQLDRLAPKVRSLELDAKKKRAVADGLIANVTRMKTVQRLERLNSSSVQVMHNGTYDARKIAPRRARLVFLSAFVGVAIGVALSFLLGVRDTKVRYATDFVAVGVPEAAVMQRARGAGRLAKLDMTLPKDLSGLSDDVPRFWASVPYDRNASGGIKIGFVACGGGADAGGAAATFAIGLAVHAGERVAYVSCVQGQGWLSRCLEAEPTEGWTDVVGGGKSLESALVQTPVPGLHYLPIGSGDRVTPHPMADAGFTGLLDELAEDFRFVIVELPDLRAVPEGRVALGIVDAVELVARAGGSQKAEVQGVAAAVRSGGARLLGAVLQG